MLHLTTLISLIAASVTCLALEPCQAGHPSRACKIPTYSNATIYAVNGTGQASYARTLELPDNTLLATWNQFGGPGGSMPIYRSRTNGLSWSPLGTVRSDVPGRTLVQPHLLYLNEHIGSYKEGTVLLSVNAWDNSSTNIEVYSSADLGTTWKFASRVAIGGRANTTNGATPVWEPFLLVQ